MSKEVDVDKLVESLCSLPGSAEVEFMVRGNDSQVFVMDYFHYNQDPDNPRLIIGIKPEEINRTFE